MAESKTCPNCGEANPARAKFCLECGSRMDEEAAQQERRFVTVLFADLSGFTAFSERSDIEEARALAHEAAEALGEIVERYGGTVDKIIGDAVMAVFGAPVSHEDDPERAVRAALDMQAYAALHKEEFARLQLTIGLNTGEAMFAPVGSSGQFTVIGDTVNTAARLQSAAGRGEILAGQPTFAATQAAIEYEAVDPIIAKNKAEPVLAWKAISIKGVRSSRIASRTTWIGRSVEIERLWELWERVRTQRQPHTAYLLGAPGVGKSRLITEFLKRLTGTSSIYWGRCLSYGEGITYWPVIEIIKDAARIGYDDSAESVSAKLGTFLEDLGTEDLDELRTMAVAAANLVAAPATPRGTYQATTISQAELHWGLRRIFQLLAAREPLVLVFEDLHWAEPTLLDLLDFLSESMETPLLILGSARPELRDTSPSAFEARATRRVIELAPLSEDQGRELLEELANEGGLSEKQIDDALKAAGGNPLFLEEMVRMVADFAMERDATELDVAPTLTIPANLKSLIGSRLDRLNVLEKRVAQYASVVGHVFWSSAVAYLAEGGTQIDIGLDALEVRDLVREQQISSIAGEREWAFKHALIRDVTYDRIPKSQRAQLHERSGKWISGLPGSEDEFVEIIAYHLEQACKLALEVSRTAAPPPMISAVQALTRAGEKAEGREGIREANRFYARALELVGTRWPETAVELRLRRARTVVALEGPDRAMIELREIGDRARELGRLDICSGALLSLASIEQGVGRIADARRILKEVESTAAGLSEARYRIRAALGLASLRADFGGESEAALIDMQEAVDWADRTEELPLRIEGHLRLGMLLYNLGRLRESEPHFEECALMARQEGSLRDEARASYFLATIKSFRGDLERGEELALKSQEWLERTGDHYLRIQTLRSLSKFALFRGDFLLAEQRLREALSNAKVFGGWLVVEMNRYLAEVFTRTGRGQEARGAANDSRAALPKEDPYATAAMLVAEGLAASGEGDEGEARKAFSEAIGGLEELKLPNELGEALIAYARALLSFGDLPGARDQLDRARDVFAPMEAEMRLAEIEQVAALAGEGASRATS